VVKLWLCITVVCVVLGWRAAASAPELERGSRIYALPGALAGLVIGLLIGGLMLIGYVVFSTP
jgi:uncharacterized membrane protein YedE/YeeE